MAFSRNAILSLLKNITVGTLKVVDMDGKVTLCGGTSNDQSSLVSAITVHKDLFWLRMLLFADLVGANILPIVGDWT